MTTDDILRQCRALDGVEVAQHDDGAELLLHTEDGSGRMRFFSVFPGLTLAWISVRAPVWPAPGVSGGPVPETGPLLINYCITGRCELVLNDSRRVYLSSGELSLTERFAQNEYVYPGGVYEGFELFIDPEPAEQGLSVLEELFGVCLPKLIARYCPSGGTYIAKFQLPQALLARLSALHTENAAIPAASFKTGVIDFLALLLAAPDAPQPEPAYYTKSQVEIAKQIARSITEDLSRTHTAREFAARFSISESSVKNYFSGVFGESLSHYTAARRMELAAKLLRETRLSVMDIAGRAGYLNQSKFSAAFRRAYACTPLEYRRKQALPRA